MSFDVGRGGGRIPDQYREEHSACYGVGCFACSNRGWFESEEGRESREDYEGRKADAQRKGEW